MIVSVKGAQPDAPKFKFRGVGTGAELLSMVEKSHHFGPGTLENEDDETIGPHDILPHGATFAWYPDPACKWDNCTWSTGRQHGHAGTACTPATYLHITRSYKSCCTNVCGPLPLGPSMALNSANGALSVQAHMQKQQMRTKAPSCL